MGRKVRTINKAPLNITQEEFLKLVNKKLPINISSLENLIERIYIRYPLIDKAQIAMIVKHVFIAMRELILIGKILNFNNFIFDMKLLINHCLHKGKQIVKSRIKMKTSPKIRGKANV